MPIRGHDSQRGQAIAIVGAMLIALTVLGVMVFDVGLAMSDRRNMQAYADAAALAGARSYGPGTDGAHWVAMEYLSSSLPGGRLLAGRILDHPERLMASQRHPRLPERARCRDLSPPAEHLRSDDRLQHAHVGRVRAGDHARTPV
jgi:Putative Flp pilus-assembly TadE/G-like